MSDGKELWGPVVVSPNLQKEKEFINKNGDKIEGIGGEVIEEKKDESEEA